MSNGKQAKRAASTLRFDGTAPIVTPRKVIQAPKIEKGAKKKAIFTPSKGHPVALGYMKLMHAVVAAKSEQWMASSAAQMQEDCMGLEEFFYMWNGSRMTEKCTVVRFTSPSGNWYVDVRHIVANDNVKVVMTPIPVHDSGSLARTEWTQRNANVVFGYKLDNFSDGDTMWMQYIGFEEDEKPVEMPHPDIMVFVEDLREVMKTEFMKTVE